MEYYLNDLGILCPLGSNKKTIIASLMRGSLAGLSLSDGLIPGRSCVVGKVDANLPSIPREFKDFDCRNNRLLLAAYQQIETSVNRVIERFGRHRIGILLGTSTSGVEESELSLKYYRKHKAWPESYHYWQQQMGSPSEFLVRYLKLNGPASTVSTACSSSVNALAVARRMLRLDVCDAVIVGGADSLCQLTLQGFASLQSISESYSKPFSSDRDGINMGEGAALFLMSREKRGVKLAGIGCSSDAYHICAPDPSGAGASHAMQAALDDAELNPSTIHYLNLHGTATQQNDSMESKAVHRIFGDQVWCSSTKSMTGHMLGAAGAVELGFCWLVLAGFADPNQLPPQLYTQTIDPDLDSLKWVSNPIQDQVPAAHCMSNSFAFGGNNVSVIISRLSKT